MPSITEIVNVALRRVGAESITSLTEATAQANAANDLVPILRDEMQRDHTWKFAKKQIELVQSATAPVYGYTFAYLLPADVLFITHMQDGAIFNIMNINDVKVLVTDNSSAKITYRSRITNTGLWDSSFISAFILKLAAELAIALGNNDARHRALMQEYLLAIDAAISTDSIEQSEVRLISPSTLVDIRSAGVELPKVKV